MLKNLQQLREALVSLGRSSKAEQVSEIIKTAQQTYKIKSGDSFYSLSNGDLQYQQLIQKANPGVDPSKLQIGQVITLPPRPLRANQNMDSSQSLMLLLKRYEGQPKTGMPYLKPYDDGFGFVTIGWGHNYGKGDYHDYLNITEAKADQLLKEDIELAATFVRKYVVPKLTQGQFDALTSLVFNSGRTKIKNSNLLKVINSGDFKQAENLFPTALIGENQGGLNSRRSEEAAMFRS